MAEEAVADRRRRAHPRRERVRANGSLLAAARGLPPEAQRLVEGRRALPWCQKGVGSTGS